MDSAILSMFQDLRERNGGSDERTLAELIQQIIVLGLTRGDFFSKAAFYGGTALRMIHGLDRFSEDLDFSLETACEGFSLARYLDQVKAELSAFGFDVEIEMRNKGVSTPIESAFVKANTVLHIMRIAPAAAAGLHIHPGSTIKIKMEIDTDPPAGASFTQHYLDDPVPHGLRAYDLPSLFAGKLAAVLARAWKHRVKGRDWYDLVFYVRKGIIVNLFHLEMRLRQTGYYREAPALDEKRTRELLGARIDEVDFEFAKQDVFPFIRRPQDLDVWSADFFRSIVQRITFE